MHRISSLSRFGFLCALLGCGTSSIEAQSERSSTGPAATLEAAFDEFVTGKNDFVSREIGGPEATRDEALAKEVRDQFEQYVKSPNMQQTFHKVSADYAQVLSEVRTQGLPDVLAAIPFHESRYQADAQSDVCAKGHWQFIPETAVRQGLTVKDCLLSDSVEPWTPTDDVVSNIEARPYVRKTEDGKRTCLIASCAMDDRTELAASTTAALSMMAKVYKIESVIKSGKAVEKTILSHHVGAERAQSSVPVSKGEYVAKVIALHLIARCVYGTHFGDAYNPYKGFQKNLPGSYCEKWKWTEPADMAGDEKPAE